MMKIKLLQVFRLSRFRRELLREGYSLKDISDWEADWAAGLEGCIVSNDYVLAATDRVRLVKLQGNRGVCVVKNKWCRKEIRFIGKE